MNGSLISKATTLEDSMTLRAVVEAPFLKEAEKLDTLFLAPTVGCPAREERDRFLKVVRASPTTPGRSSRHTRISSGLCLNSPEFVLCP